MPKNKQTPEWRKGYRAAKSQAVGRASAIVAKIVTDINARSGLSPMLWSDREQRQKVVDEWTLRAKEVLENL